MIKIKNRYSVLLFIACLFGQAAFSDDIALLHKALEETGRHHLSFRINGTDQKTIMPITVITGHKAGPTLLVLSGIHGSEYAPIVASQRLAPALEPSTVSGKVIFVHIANMPAYLGRTIYTSPADQKNLNRIFPGKANGTVSDRIAFALTDQLYPLADAVLDMHSGDGNEDLKPMWIGYYGKAGDPNVIAQSKAMALAFGFDHIVEFQWELTDRQKAIWAGSAAVALGIPSIDVEAGGRNTADSDAVAAIERGITRTMAHLKMTSQTFPTNEKQIVIRNRTWISAPQDGSWIAIKQAGEEVRKGERIGYLTDWYGNVVFEAHAPRAGLLLLTLTAPPALSGETLAIIAEPN